MQRTNARKRPPSGGPPNEKISQDTADERKRAIGVIHLRENKDKEEGEEGCPRRSAPRPPTPITPKRCPDPPQKKGEMDVLDERCREYNGEARTARPNRVTKSGSSKIKAEQKQRAEKKELGAGPESITAKSNDRRGTR